MAIKKIVAAVKKVAKKTVAEAAPVSTVDTSSLAGIAKASAEPTLTPEQLQKAVAKLSSGKKLTAAEAKALGVDQK
jgi:hypothetical protein